MLKLYSNYQEMLIASKLSSEAIKRNYWLKAFVFEDVNRFEQLLIRVHIAESENKKRIESYGPT